MLKKSNELLRASLIGLILSPVKSLIDFAFKCRCFIWFHFYRIYKLKIKNDWNGLISSFLINSVMISYYILNDQDNVIIFDGIRMIIIGEINPYEKAEVFARIYVDPILKTLHNYKVLFTFVQENCFLLDSRCKSTIVNLSIV